MSNQRQGQGMTVERRPLLNWLIGFVCNDRDANWKCHMLCQRVVAFIKGDEAAYAFKANTVQCSCKKDRSPSQAECTWFLLGRLRLRELSLSIFILVTDMIHIVMEVLNAETHISSNTPHAHTRITIIYEGHATLQIREVGAEQEEDSKF